MNSGVTIYDTTLRDGSQGEGVNFSLADKLKIAERLAQFGAHYIEGGWPGSNEKDLAFFREAQRRDWGRAKIAAFGSTRKAGVTVSADPQVRLLLDAETPVVTFFGKAWLLHVEKVLRTTPDENLRMIADTVAFLKQRGREVIFDAEHFFDGYQAAPDYALKTLTVARDAGADAVVLCDTNGGMLPSAVGAITAAAGAALGVGGRRTVGVGIHSHNDCGLGVANAVAAIEAGATQVQGTINGFGERTGNCNLTSVIPILELKLNRPALPAGHLRQLSEVSRFVDEIANLRHDTRAPFVGLSAFAHKGGMHVNAVNKAGVTYEHIPPELVGNRQRILVGELSGRANVMLKARELGIELTAQDPRARQILDRIKTLENLGYEFESADATFELIVRQILGNYAPFFSLDTFNINYTRTSGTSSCAAELTVTVPNRGEPIGQSATGDGPVNALDQALRQALTVNYPAIANITLIDYKVRILNTAHGTAARTRVLITSSDGNNEWSTVGVSDNVIEASWLALADSVEYYLLKQAAP
ncbi:MAG: citramalate synthase [Verrucomicrobiales bacterium]|jgi:2-isopropylmalate synthase|nr:citramalate synthase [Verrucomicrobiales bacterium]